MIFLKFFSLHNSFLKNIFWVLKRKKNWRGDFWGAGSRWVGKRYTSSFDHDP